MSNNFFETPCIFLDHKKAFDTVDHKILLEKLRKYGVRELSGDWFQSYLENRRQYCAANSYESRPRVATCGIPPGFLSWPPSLHNLPE